MKKVKYIFPLLFVAVLLFTACSEDKLEIPQKGVVTIDSFYETDDDAESAMTAAYADFITNIGGNDGTKVPYNIIFNYKADNVLAAGNMYADNDEFGSINEFRHDANNPVVTLGYRRWYFAIYSANLVINNFEYGESAVKDRVISEARVMRAWLHMKLAMAWGNPPLITELLAGDARPLNYEGGHEALLQWCATECAESVQYLDERKSPADKDGAVKITKGFAWTVQGQALLYAGDYAGAKAPLKNVITSGKYALVPGAEWGDLFHIGGDGNEEKVFELNLINNANIGDWDGKIQRSTWMEMNAWGWRSDKLAAKPVMQADGGWGGLAVEGDFAAEFHANDGDSYRRKATIITYEEFLTEIEWPNDEGDINSMTKAEKLQDPKRGINAAVGLYGQCEYLQVKHIVAPEDRTTGWYRFNNFIITRYADVLLMYAEACAQTTDEGSLGLQSLQEVQTRAGAPVSALLTLETVQKERNYELWMEGARWIDMKRWGQLEKAKNAGNDIPTLYDAFFTKDEATHRGYLEITNPSKDVQHGFVTGKHEYYPYPDAIISINPNLVQNPGWE
jgi:hypothetical protein